MKANVAVQVSLGLIVLSAAAPALAQQCEFVERLRASAGQRFADLRGGPVSRNSSLDDRIGTYAPNDGRCRIQDALGSFPKYQCEYLISDGREAAFTAYRRVVETTRRCVRNTEPDWVTSAPYGGEGRVFSDGRGRNVEVIVSRIGVHWYVAMAYELVPPE